MYRFGRRARRGGRRALACAAALATLLGGLAAGPKAVAGAAPNDVVPVVAAENQYGNVAAQIGGRFVSVSSVESNPNTDPHSYEVSPAVAARVARARLVIQNGLGYDGFMNRLESGSFSRTRQVIDVQHLLGLPDSTPNPHLWYSPKTMPAVAEAIARDLARLDPAHRAYFRSRARKFDTALQPWLRAIAAFKVNHGGVRGATTEPVANYLLQAMGIDNLTPFAFQADIMNGVDPTPQDVALENGFFTKHQVRVFLYNQQVVDPLTASIRANARKAGIPVVAVYETMPTPGYSYQRWMLAETDAIEAAVLRGKSMLQL